MWRVSCRVRAGRPKPVRLNVEGKIRIPEYYPTACDWSLAPHRRRAKSPCCYKDTLASCHFPPAEIPKEVDKPEVYQRRLVQKTRLQELLIDWVFLLGPLASPPSPSWTRPGEQSTVCLHRAIKFNFFPYYLMPTEAEPAADETQRAQILCRRNKDCGLSMC